MRFQPVRGRYLAAASDNVVNILDVETQACLQSLKSLELWNMDENRSMTLAAHGGLISDMAVSTVTGFIASASHDKTLKLWK